MPFHCHIIQAGALCGSMKIVNRKLVGHVFLLLGTSSAMQNELVYKNLGLDSHCDLDTCRKAHLILKTANTTGYLRFAGKIVTLKKIGTVRNQG